MKRLYVLDLDGTVYRGGEALPFAADAVRELIARGATVRYFTNNSAAVPARVSAKLGAMGVPCEPGWVYGTGPLAGRACASRGYRTAFVVGEPELVEAVVGAGVRAIDGAREPSGEEGGVDCVVVGICRSFTYALLDRASRLARAGAPLVATNRDATYPVEGGREQPGAGAIVAAVEAASGASVVELGKPQTALLDWILADTGASAAETMVVGDRYETDVLCGLNAGCDVRLVLTGVSSSSRDGVVAIDDLRGLLG